MKLPKDGLAEAHHCAEREDWRAAVEVLRQTEQTAEVLESLAYYLSLLRDYHGALDVTASFRKLRPDDVRGYYMAGYQFYKQKRFREAVPWFEQALQADPAHMKSRRALINALAKLGRRAEVERAASEVLRIWASLKVEQRRDLSTYARACYILGKASLQRQPELSLEYFDAACKAEPDDAWHHWGRGRALLSLRRVDEALEAHTLAAALKPGDIWIELERARAAAATGAQDAALETLRQNQRRVRSWEAERAGQVARRLGEDRLAVEFFSKAATDPGSGGNDRVVRELAEARRAAGLPESQVDEPRWGRVQLVRQDRNFGFLLDEVDGARRHFRLPRGRKIVEGDRLRFLPRDREKGPAAELFEVAANRQAARRRDGRGKQLQ